MASVYIKPGVYSQYVRTPGSVNINAGIRTVSVIGVGANSFTAEDEAVVRGSGYPYAPDTADALAYSASEIVAVGDFPGGNNYTVNTDYILTDGKVDWSPGGNEPAVGATYYVTYKHVKVAADYDPQLFVKVSDIENEYGRESNVNTLSMGAKIAAENGGAFIICTQVTADNSVAFKEAIDKLKQKTDGVDSFIIIPMTTDASVQAYLKSHIEFMSSQFQRKERHGLVSLAIGAANSEVKAKAQALAFNRLILPWDEATREYIDDNNEVQSITVDGTFIGCAIAGMIVKYPVQEPLTRKTVNGFTAITKANELLETEKDDLAGAGVLLLEENAGIITVRHGMTTDTSTPEDNEISIMQIRDNTIKVVRDSLDKLHIAKVGTADTPAAIKTDLEAVLGILVDEGSLIGFGAIDVTQNPANRTEYFVEFAIDPAAPVNRIYIKFTISK